MLKKSHLILLAFTFLLSKNIFAMELKSKAFKNNEYIPKKYSCLGEDISPELEWKDAPQNTVTFVLICDDPDAPVGVWDHWVIYNIPANKNKLEEGIPKIGKLSDGSLQGKNSWGKIGYGGPCPPPGPPHRYIFKLYALDTTLQLKPGATKTEILDAIKGHILATAQLTGLFKR